MPEIGLKIEGIWDEKGGSFAEGKKRVRDEEEKKGKKERIHNVGRLDEGGDGDGEVVSEDTEDENGELMVDGDDGVANEEEAVNSEIRGEEKEEEEDGKEEWESEEREESCGRRRWGRA